MINGKECERSSDGIINKSLTCNLLYEYTLRCFYLYMYSNDLGILVMVVAAESSYHLFMNHFSEISRRENIIDEVGE